MGNNKQKLTHSKVLRLNFGYKEAEVENGWEKGANAGEIWRRSDVTTLPANGNKRKCSLSPCGYFRDLPIQFWCLEWVEFLRAQSTSTFLRPWEWKPQQQYIQLCTKKFSWKESIFFAPPYPRPPPPYRPPTTCFIIIPFFVILPSFVVS